MPGSFRLALISAGMALCVAQAATSLDLWPDSCLEKLGNYTRDWTECTQRFSRSDNRCKPAAQNMHIYMQKCKEKGYEKAQIDQAMKLGYQAAGKPRKQ